MKLLGEIPFVYCNWCGFIGREENEWEARDLEPKHLDLHRQGRQVASTLPSGKCVTIDPAVAEEVGK